MDSLAPEEVARRIKAARLLHDISQRELAERIAADGLAWRLVGALERGEVELRSVHRRALCEALHVPERWFTDPVESLCPDVLPISIEDRLETIASGVERILGRLKP